MATTLTGLYCCCCTRTSDCCWGGGCCEILCMLDDWRLCPMLSGYCRCCWGGGTCWDWGGGACCNWPYMVVHS